MTSTDMDQKFLAKSLDISASQISRMIRGNVVPSMEFWHRVSVQYGINFDAIQTGLITTLPSDNEIVLKRFAPTIKNNFTLGNTVLMHKTVFIHYWGEKVFNDFCESLKIDPLLFINTNNPANLDFTLRMIQYSILKKRISTVEDIKSYSEFAFKSLQGKEKFHFIYNTQPGISKLANLISNIEDQFEKNHLYKIEDINLNQEWIDITFYPEEHVDMNFYKNDPVLGNSYEKYVQYFMACFLGPKASIHIKQSIFKGDEKCTFRLQKL